MQSNRDLPLGRPPGSAPASPLSVHGSWLPAGALLTAHLALTAYADRSLVASVLLALATVALYFVCAVVHALAHRICARLVGARLESSRIFVFGDLTEPGTSSGDRRKDIAVALAGPVTSVALGAASLLGSTFVEGDVASILRTVAWVNAGLAVVNLLPALPLDGGRLIALGSRRRARLASFGGKLVGLIAVVGGGWLLVKGPQFTDETAAGLWLVLIGIFVFLGSGPGSRPAPLLPKVDGRTVGEWARPFVGRLDATSLAPAGGGPYAVSDKGRLAGVLTESLVQHGVKVGDLMVPWDTNLGMSSDAPLVGALRRLSENAPLVIVIDGEGVVRGVLDEGAVRERLGTV